MRSHFLRAKRCLVIASACGLLATASYGANDEQWQSEFATKVERARASSQIVGLGAIVMQDSKILALATAGERVHDSGVLITSDDQWHLGSISKSMTATLLARLVEKGLIDWDLRLGEVFNSVFDLHPQWQAVTLQQLLSHTSGAPRDLPMLATLQDPEEGDERTLEREKQILKILRKAPKSPPGTEYQYSNVGYTIAGVVAEKISGKTWESLIRDELFAPLSLGTGGFGAPHSATTTVEQPKGHRHILSIVRAANADDELTPLIGPAGSIHMNLKDLMLYADNHLQGERGKDGILSAATFKTLHTPIANNYAMGWNVATGVEWSPSPIIWHAGSNGMWCAVLALLPQINAALAVTSNDCNDRDNTFDAIWDLIQQSVAAL